MKPTTIEIHDIALDDAGWDAYSSILNREEQARAARFYQPLHGRRFARCRTALRLLLGCYLEQSGAAVQIQNGPFGKPFLPEDTALHFSVSHSADRALLAFGPHPLGVDLEAWQAKTRDLDGLASLICHPNEKACFDRLDAMQREAWFFSLWTYKEAFCKAIGLGLQQSLPSIYPEYVESEGWRKMMVEPASDTQWMVVPIDLDHAFKAALCTAEPLLPWTLKHTGSTVFIRPQAE
jgi:4'-phosphopantetheinyl transferase